MEETVSENFLNLARNINLQSQEVEQTPNRINPKKPMPRHNIIKLLKSKEKGKILESRQKSLTLLMAKKQLE